MFLSYPRRRNLADTEAKLVLNFPPTVSTTICRLYSLKRISLRGSIISLHVLYHDISHNTSRWQQINAKHLQLSWRSLFSEIIINNESFVKASIIIVSK